MPPYQSLVGDCGAFCPMIPVPYRFGGKQAAVAVLDIFQLAVVHQLAQSVFANAADLAHLLHCFEDRKGGGFYNCLSACRLSRHNKFLLFVQLIMAYSLKGIWIYSVFKVRSLDFASFAAPII